MAPAVAAGAATAARVSPAGSAVLESAGVDALRGAARIAPSLFLSAISGAGLAAQQAAAYGAPAFQEASAGAAKRSPAGTPFDARAMHLFVDSQGVHAFIRDTALQANELRTVAQGLAAEMAATGQQLASLTVNGKNVAARTPHAEAEEDDAVFQQNPDGGAESSLRYPSQPVSEGNP
ncbi:hypothetical protein ASF77_21950 [Massilia sp. Leaf139]|nr:hypothetical protein ASF77_21950 [Massilia sp. Leaf139]